MWLADSWKDYEVLDTSAGEKLERWGKYILVRPDPQVIWNTPKDDPLWRKYDARYARSNTGGGKWQNLRLPEQWQVRYKELTFQVKPMNFKHTGVFPEQAANWDFMMETIRNAGRPVRVLNLFAYTGGATIACAAAGASVCHVDAAKGMVALGKGKRKGLRAGGQAHPLDRGRLRQVCRARDPPRHDAMTQSSWTRRATGAARPARSGSWRRTCIRLWSWSASVLSDDPLFVIINSYTTGLAPSVVGYLDGYDRLRSDTAAIPSLDELGLPVTRFGPGSARAARPAAGQRRSDNDRQPFRSATCITVIRMQDERAATHVVFDGLRPVH